MCLRPMHPEDLSLPFLLQVRLLSEHELLGVDSAFFSAIALLRPAISPGFLLWFYRKKDPWKEWGSYP